MKLKLFRLVLLVFLAATLPSIQQVQVEARFRENSCSWWVQCTQWGYYECISVAPVPVPGGPSETDFTDSAAEDNGDSAGAEECELYEYRDPYTCYEGYITTTCWDMEEPPPPDLFGGGDVAASVVVTVANIENNSVVVQLSPADLSGRLTVKVIADDNAEFVLLDEIKGSGSHSMSFKDAELTSGKYWKRVYACWQVSENPCGERPVAFMTLGEIRYTQYNTPSESECSGAPVTLQLMNSGCGVQDGAAEVKGGFYDQVTNINYGTGSGRSSNYGIVYYPWSCFASHNPRRLKKWVEAIRGSAQIDLVAGLSVAVDLSQMQTLSINTNLKLIGNSTKTVHDNCPACGTTKIDSYSASEACSGNAVGDLGNFRTIRLR